MQTNRRPAAVPMSTVARTIGLSDLVTMDFLILQVMEQVERERKAHQIEFTL